MTPGRPRKKTGALAAGTLVLAAMGCSAREPGLPRVQAARVILITCDTLRADRLGLYGYPRPTSPALDAFARESVVFEEAYSAAPWTQPAVSSLMTGRAPEEIGVVPGNVRRIGPDVETIAERFAARGIATAAVVSNLLLKRVEPPPGVQGPIGVSQGFGHYDDRMLSKESVRKLPERVASDTTAAAIEWLDSRGARAKEPFFLWVHYQDPHGPYTPPAEQAREFDQPVRDPTQLPLGKSMRGKDQIPLYQALDDERRVDVYRDRYDAEIRTFDRALGRLLAELEQRGLYEDALIVFSADHGESLGEHGYWFCHGENLHREVVRVPLVVRFPGGDGRGVEPGADGVRRVATIASHYDLWPTMLGALDIAPGPSRGLALLEPQRLPLERAVVQDFQPLEQARWWAVSDGRYRLVWSADNPAGRLFDIRSDPEERNDLANEDPARVRAMQAAHARWVSTRVGAVSSGSATASDLTEDLQRLGYVERAGGGD